jgi:phosphoribosyl 1,2-cyclic phosphodiesterase
MNLAICSLASGSSGNCYVVCAGTRFVLVDAGISGKQIREGLASLGLSPENLCGVFLTHSHGDHVKGLAQVMKHAKNASVYANDVTLRESGLTLAEERIRRFETGETFFLGDLEVRTFPVSHDTGDPAGFTFRRGGRQLSIVTDTGVVTPAVAQQIRGADLLVLESNHDVNILRMGHYPWFLKQRILGETGHLSNEAAASALADALLAAKAAGERADKTVLLAHLSKENNFPEMAMATVNNILEERGALTAGLRIEILSRSATSDIYSI